MDPRFGEDRLEFWEVMPFTIALSLYASLLLFSCLFILMCGNHQHTIRSNFYASLLGLCCSVGIGVYLNIQFQEFNAITRMYPK